MELLTDSETRDFSRFLDSFASSSSGPPPSSSSTSNAVASASSALGFAAPPPPPQAVGSSSRRTLAHGGAATWDLGGWADSASQLHAARLPHPPPPPLLSHRSSSGSVPLAHRPHGYATAPTSGLTSLPRPPHLSSDLPGHARPPSHLPVPPSLAPHYQQHHAHHSGDAPPALAEPDASKRARMAQHARDLEAWMGRAPSRPPAGGAGDDDEDDEDEGGREERGLPPLKRARSEDGPARGRGSGGGGREGSRARRVQGGEDPLVLMLEEAERRAGWPGAAAVSGAGVGARAGAAREAASAPAPLHAAASAAAVDEQAEAQRDPTPPVVAAPAKRKSAQASTTSKKKRAALDDAPAPEPSPSPHVAVPAPSRKSGAKKKAAASAPAAAAAPPGDTPMGDDTSRAASPAPTLPVPPGAINNDDPDAPHDNPGPLVTPRNIPRLAARPRRLLGPSRASSTPSESPAPASAGASTSGAAYNANKGVLLTAEQKKANHIASEQKRRAAIRQGYDGLCEVVPALRAAVQEFEERVRKVTGGAAGGAGGGGEGEGALEGAKGGKGKKRAGRGLDGQSTTGALMGGIQVGGEKIDGRAGPKSEAVVLGKSASLLPLAPPYLSLSPRAQSLTLLVVIARSRRARALPPQPALDPPLAPLERLRPRRAPRHQRRARAGLVRQRVGREVGREHARRGARRRHQGRDGRRVRRRGCAGRVGRRVRARGRRLVGATSACSTYARRLSRAHAVVEELERCEDDDDLSARCPFRERGAPQSPLPRFRNAAGVQPDSLHVAQKASDEPATQRG